MRAAVLVAALVLACGSSSSPASSGGAQMGAACTCSGATDAGGDFLCSGNGQTTCASTLYCIDGTCSTFCQLDAGTCPSGFVCKQTSHSNLTIYCAPQ